MEGKATDFPDGLTFETVVVSMSIFTAKFLLDDGEIEQSEFEMFNSEIFGALAGKNSDQRASERLSGWFDGEIKQA
jgi:hypothetical protein